MQSGVGVECTVGIPVGELLIAELGVSEEILAQVDAILLDGMPVDDLTAAVVPDGARLALAAGLPGIAGLAMKRGSAVRALRGGITHTTAMTPDPKPGRITLLLYSLTIEMLGAHFLAQGVLVTAEQLRRYGRFAPGDSYRLGGDAPAHMDWTQYIAINGDETFLLEVKFSPDDTRNDLTPCPRAHTVY